MNLMQGDCLERMKEIEDDAVDMVITSPPYNRKRNDKYNNHDDIVSDYVGFLSKSIRECIRVCNGNVFFNVQKNTYNHADVHRIFGLFAEEIIEVIIWEKSNPMPNPHLINSYEYILVLSDSNKSLKAKTTYTKNHFTTPVYSANKYKSIHRAVMHPDACGFLLDNFALESRTVLDPFMGLGTTGIECSKRGIDFIGIELDKQYFKIAKERVNLSRLTTEHSK